MFGRRKKIDRNLREKGVPPTVDTVDDEEVVATTGPFDIADAPDDLGGYLDFGPLKLKPRPNFDVRLELAADGKLNGIALVNGSTLMQLGVFAAPRSGGAWESIREEIELEISRAGGDVEEADGPLGTELIATLRSPQGDQAARFIGVDGPRWFVRGLIAGALAHDDAGLTEFYEIYRSIVVDRGTEPRPVREPITLTVPEALAAQVAQATEAAQKQAAQRV